MGSFVLTSTLLYGLDVVHGEESLKNTQSSIVSVLSASSKQDSTHAIVDGAGWGNLDASHTAAALPALAENGNVWAIHYDNTGIDTGKIAEQLIQKAHSDGINEISFLGHSMGGLVDLEVARKIYESHTHIQIPYIILDCTPASIDAVRPNVQNDGYNMIHALSYIPGAVHSSAVRFIAEETARLHQYEDLSSPFFVDLEKLYQTTEQVINDKFLSKDIASTALLDSQFKFIVASGAKDNIMALGKNNGKQKPVLIYLRPKSAAADRTVDNDFSQNLFEHYAKAAGLTLLVIDIPGIGHANPIERPTEYNTALTKTIFPKITLQEMMTRQRLERTDLALLNSTATHSDSNASK